MSRCLRASTESAFLLFLNIRKARHRARLDYPGNSCYWTCNEQRS